MNDYEKVEECLKIIRKNGDLYDVIALKEGKMIENDFSKANFLKANILLFSRILYGGVIVYEKIKSIFAPTMKIKKARDQIRQILGVNVDMIRPKSNEWFVFDGMASKSIHIGADFALLYEDDKASIKEYVASLKKILRFSELHQLKTILLKEADIMSLFGEVDLKEYIFVARNRILNCTSKGICFHNEGDSYDVKKELTSEFLVLTNDELRELIKKLESIKIDKKRVLSLSENIQDLVIKKAVNTFLQNNNLRPLKMIVKERLMSVINSDSSYRDSVHGKVSQKIEINGKYVNVVSMNEKDEVIEQFVTTLYDYLEVLDYSHLLKRASFKNDGQEILRISALYLYLFQDIKKDMKESLAGKSFYDYVFQKYEEKQKHKRKNIPGLYTKKEKLQSSITNVFMGFGMTAILLLTVLLGTVTMDVVEYYCFGEKPNIYENVLETVLKPYVRSAQYELKLGKKLFGKIRGVLPELEGNDTIKKLLEGSSEAPFSNVKTIGDAETLGDQDEIIATIFPLSLNETMPKYYATEYACNAIYDNGTIRYYSMQEKIHFSEIEQVETLFKIQYSISKEELFSTTSNMMHGNFLTKMIYPVGENYVLTNILVSDEKDPLKMVEIYKEGDRIFADSDGSGNFIDILNSIENPQVCLTYGISKINQNSFVEDMKKLGENSYIGARYSSEDIRNAVIRGLGLKEDATDEEAFEAIRSKLYSLTPIKDAGLIEKLEDLTEIEFYETIASLDSLVCNLSAMLATGIDDELIYTFGYFSDDNQITGDEKHAWAMTKTGEIIDVTPTEEKDNLVATIFDYGMKYHIPAPLLIAFASYISYKLFGKKIKFWVDSKRLEQTLESENFEETYAKLKETIYGGIHVPVSRDLTETVKTIDEEFCSFTLQELKDLKKKLKQTLNEGDLKASSELIDQIPFIREHNEEIQKVFQKRKENM